MVVVLKSGNRERKNTNHNLLKHFSHSQKSEPIIKQIEFIFTIFTNFIFIFINNMLTQLIFILHLPLGLLGPVRARP